MLEENKGIYYMHDAGPHMGKLVAKNGELEIIDCWQCGYAHLRKLPTQSEVDDYYISDKFYATYSPKDWLEREKQEHLANLWDSYYEWETRKFDGAQIMDIGCGAGWFGYYASHNCCMAVGVDPSESARDFTNSKRIYATIEEAQQHFPHFHTNSARMRLVLEHLLDPLAMLKRCREIVGVNGLLEIVVPLELNPLQQKIRADRGDYTDWFVQQPHINYFTKGSIKKLVESAGYKVVYEGATFPMEIWYLLGKKYIGNDVMGHDLHIKRLELEKKFGHHIFDIYGMLYRKFGIGREAILFARKI